MRAFLQAARPLLQAFGTTMLAIAAFALMVRAGFGLETSLITALILAGALNIHALASLNLEALLPTSRMPVGDL